MDDACASRLGSRARHRQIQRKTGRIVKIGLMRRMAERPMGQRTINLLDDGAERNLQPASILQTGQILQPYGRIHFEPVPRRRARICGGQTPSGEDMPSR